MDSATLTQEVVPAVAKAVRVYHTAALIRAPDAAADPVAETGREILQAIYWRTRPVQPLETAVDDLAASPDSPDAVAGLRIQIGKALGSDEFLRAEVERLRGGSTPEEAAAG